MQGGANSGRSRKREATDFDRDGYRAPRKSNGLKKTIRQGMRLAVQWGGKALGFPPQEGAQSRRAIASVVDKRGGSSTMASAVWKLDPAPARLAKPIVELATVTWEGATKPATLDLA